MRTIQIIEDGIPRARDQLLQSEERLANLSNQPEWDNLSAKDQALLTREAEKDVNTSKKSLSDAQSALAKLKGVVNMTSLAPQMIDRKSTRLNSSHLVI